MSAGKHASSLLLSADVLSSYGFRTLYTALLLFGWGVFRDLSTWTIFLVALITGLVLDMTLTGKDAIYQHAAGITLISGFAAVHLLLGRHLLAASWNLSYAVHKHLRTRRSRYILHQHQQQQQQHQQRQDAHPRQTGQSWFSANVPIDTTFGTVLLTLAVILLLVTVMPATTDSMHILPVSIPAITATIVVLLWRAGYRDHSRAHLLATRLICELVVVAVILRSMHELAAAAFGLVFTLVVTTAESTLLTVLIHRIPE